MAILFKCVDLAALAGEIREHYGTCGVIDSFLEDRIRESTHYRIEIDTEPAGFTSVSDSNRLTQFCLHGPHRRFGQQAFRAARQLENVDSAFVPTSDEFYVSHALDDYREVEKQAYLFELGAQTEYRVPHNFELRRAVRRDAALITKHCGELFTDLQKHIGKGEVFVSLRGGTAVGVGVRQVGEFCPEVASIGMQTFEAFRRSGVGTATIASLIDRCLAEGLRPVAGCWYYNHASKKTLERAGMVATARLLRVLF